MDRMAIAGACAAVGLCLGGCLQSPPLEDPPWPQFPLCFVEATAHKQVFEKIGNIQPIPAREVLLIPYYSVQNKIAGQYGHVVAHPFLYCPQTRLVVPQYKEGSSLRRIVVVCPGYLGRRVHASWYCTDTINETECQLVEIIKARSSTEADRVLLDFEYLLSQQEFRVGPTMDPLTVGQNEQHVYATSGEFLDPLYPEQDRRGWIPIWGLEPGTRVMVDVTESELQMVREFVRTSLSPRTVER